MGTMEKIDLIIVGATGFTGKHTVKNLLKIIKRTPELSDVTWGISARSKEKIQNLLTELEDLGQNKLNTTVIECDVQKDDLRELTRKTRVLLNCTGPNTILSEPIVKACLETNTHYVDISAENYHMLNLYKSYHQKAEQANVIIVPACGFAVVPALTGLMYLEKNFNGTINTAECYTEIILPKRAYFPGPNKCLVHYGTWASLVHELQNFQDSRRLRNEIFSEDIYGPEPAGVKRSFFHKYKGKIWFPYPGPDETLVDMSQRYLHEKKQKRPYHFKMYTTTPMFFHMLFVLPFMFLYYYLCYFKWFRNLLWNYPRLFTLGYMSHKGPTEKMANDTKFAFTFVGKGVDEYSKEKSLSVKLTGSDPGYKTTSITLLVAALTILKESANIPKGGVLSIGAAFQDTNIIDSLIKNEGIGFEVITN